MITSIRHRNQEPGSYNAPGVKLQALSPISFDRYLANIRIKVNDIYIIDYCERYIFIDGTYALYSGESSWFQGYGYYKIKRHSNDLFLERTLDELGTGKPAEEVNYHIRKFIKKVFEEQQENSDAI